VLRMMARNTRCWMGSTITLESSSRRRWTTAGTSWSVVLMALRAFGGAMVPVCVGQDKDRSCAIHGALWVSVLGSPFVPHADTA